MSRSRRNQTSSDQRRAAAAADLIDLAKVWGAKVIDRSVCAGHSAPLDFLMAWVHDRPPISLVHGPRGGGKSFLRALATHFDSIHYDRHATRILGGSLAQSKQVYHALRSFEARMPGLFQSFTAARSVYLNGSDVEVLAASSKSVRGPHVPSLALDEVDEIDAELREAAMGMSMATPSASAMVSMTSTWHRIGGAMAGLVDRAESGAFPFWRFCAFEILETCSEARSGPQFENCPACPLVSWCHDSPDGRPKAKRSAGHYAIDSLIQKVQATSRRTFEADYLCKGPKADGLWFTEFDDSNISPRADYDPRLELHLAVDPGVTTGAVFFQTLAATDPNTGNDRTEVRVVADLLVENRAAEDVARELREIARTRFHDRIDRWSLDSAGSARNAVGPRLIELYALGGLRDPRFWPKYPGSVADQLGLLESLIRAADGHRALLVHPSCKATIHALTGYRRAKRGGQWQDYPEDPQHPHEDLVDALRGGVATALPWGRDRRSAGLRPVPGNYLT
jgi:hypothetical protein